MSTEDCAFFGMMALALSRAMATAKKRKARRKRKQDSLRSPASGGAERSSVAAPEGADQRDRADRAAMALPTWTRQAVIALLVVGVVAIYFAVPTYDFLTWDDRAHTIENRHIADTGYFWGHFQQGMYMPVTFTVWSLLYRVVGAEAGAYHLCNLVLHAANAVMVFLVLERLLALWVARTPAESSSARSDEAPSRHVALAAGAGAMVFAWHPLQAEPVSWITSLKDVSYAFFGLIALYAYLRSVDAAPDRRRWLWLGSLAALVVATLCKPSAVCVVFMLAALNLWWLRLPWRRALWRTLPFALVALPSAVLNGMSQHGLTLLYHTPLAYRPLVALDSLGFYLERALFPIELLPAYERSPRWLIESGRIAYSWLPGAAAVLVAVWVRKRLPRLFASFALFVCGVVLVLGLSNFAAQDNTTVYDRYVYLAMLGAALLGAVVVLRLRRRWQLAAVAVLLLALGAKSAVQSRYWKDERTLWTYALSKNPNAAAALVSLGMVHSRDGERERARELYQRAVEVKPYDAHAHNNLGAMLASMGRIEDAGEHFQRAVALNPHDVSSRNNLSRYYFETGQLAESERHVRAVLNKVPQHTDANLRLGEILLQQGRLRECIAHMQQAVQWMADNPDALTLLGVAHAQHGQEGLAVGYFRRALQVRPDHPSARRNLDVALERIRLRQEGEQPP